MYTQDSLVDKRVNELTDHCVIFKSSLEKSDDEIKKFAHTLEQRMKVPEFIGNIIEDAIKIQLGVMSGPKNNPYNRKNVELFLEHDKKLNDYTGEGVSYQKLVENQTALRIALYCITEYYKTIRINLDETDTLVKTAKNLKTKFNLINVKEVALCRQLVISVKYELDRYISKTNEQICNRLSVRYEEYED